MIILYSQQKSYNLYLTLVTCRGFPSTYAYFDLQDKLWSQQNYPPQAPFKMGKLPKAVLMYFRLGCIYILHTLFIGLVLGRVIGNTDWNWFLVFIPLFIFDAVAAIYWIIYLVMYIWMRVNDELDDDIGNRAGGGVCLKLYDDKYKPICFPNQSMALLVIILYLIGAPFKLIIEVLLCLSFGSIIPFYVPAILMSLFFIGLCGVMLYYSLKPSIELIRGHGCCR